MVAVVRERGIEYHPTLKESTHRGESMQALPVEKLQAEIWHEQVLGTCDNQT